jgi:hypothetical protein
VGKKKKGTRPKSCNRGHMPPAREVDDFVEEKKKHEILFNITRSRS